MFFEEHEKQIYQPPGSDRKYDPIRVDRILTAVTKGRLNELVTYRNALHDDKGDVSKEGKTKALELAALAELELADAARKAFELPPFPDCGDATALETLYHFLGWMEGKGKTAGKPPQSPVSFPDRALHVVTKDSSVSSSTPSG